MAGDFAEVALDQLNYMAANSISNKWNDPWLEYFHEKQVGPIKPNLNLPPIANLDDTFTNYFFNGGNPKSIRRACKVEDLPYYQDFLDTDKSINLKKLAAEHKVFYIDCRVLEKFEYPVMWRGMFIHAPTVVFYQDVENKIKILGIRFNKPPKLGSTDKKSYKIFTPNSS